MHYKLISLSTRAKVLEPYIYLYIYQMNFAIHYGIEYYNLFYKDTVPQTKHLNIDQMNFAVVNESNN